MGSYERSRSSTVSTFFGKVCFDASKALSPYKLYYEYPSLFRKLVFRQNHSMRLFSPHREIRDFTHVEISETLFGIVESCDYHLICILKCNYVFNFNRTAGIVGYEPVTDLFILKGECDVAEILEGSLESGNLELSRKLLPIAVLEIEERVKECAEEGIVMEKEDVYGDLFYCAGQSGNKDVVLMLNNELTSVTEEDYLQRVFKGLCRKGHLELCLWIIDFVNDYNITSKTTHRLNLNYFAGFELACESDRLNIVKFLVETVLLFSTEDNNDSKYKGPYKAAFYGHYDIVKYIANVNITDIRGISWKDYWEAVLQGVCKGKSRRKRIIRLVKKSTKNIHCNHCGKVLEGH